MISAVDILVVICFQFFEQLIFTTADKADIVSKVVVICFQFFEQLIFATTWIALFH